MAFRRHQNKGLTAYLTRRLGAPKGSHPELMFFCPFCVDRIGDESRKPKLAINVDSKLVHCWRCDYRSHDLVRFFRDVNGGKVSPEELSLAENDVSVESPDELHAELITRWFASDDQQNQLRRERLPAEYQVLPNTEPSCRWGMAYLRKRKLAEEKVKAYRIGYCASGEYAKRLIFPVYVNGLQVYFTSRYCGESDMKSKNPKKRLDADGNVTHLTKEHVLLNFDGCVGAKRVYVCEGPISSMAFDHGVALLGKTISKYQVELLKELSRRGTREFVVALDADAWQWAEDIYYRIAGLLPGVSVLPIAYGDPDERRADLPQLIADRRPPSLLDRVVRRLA